MRLRISYSCHLNAHVPCMIETLAGQFSNASARARERRASSVHECPIKAPVVLYSRTKDRRIYWPIGAQVSSTNVRAQTECPTVHF